MKRPFEPERIPSGVSSRRRGILILGKLLHGDYNENEFSQEIP